jgi:hypothetical protein
MRAALSHILEQKPAIIQTRGIMQQFDQMLLAPFRQVMFTGPVVIVIDALDESNSTSRNTLLSALMDKLPDLPPYIRIIITSRPETDIRAALGNHKSVLWKQMGDIAINSTSHDIAQYIHNQLQGLQGSFTDYKATCNDLVETAGTLFQWAYTACRIIKGSQQRMFSVDERAKSILSMSKYSATLQGLDQLYMNILLQVFEDGPVPDRYKIVMSHILAAVEPLSVQSLDDLLVQSGALKPGEVDMVIGQLGALLSGTDKSHRVVRPLHTSFRDFLVDRSRGSRFAIELGTIQDLSFVRGSLAILNKQLDFNMCKLETSYKLNSDYGDLKPLLIRNTSASMVYAAVYWGKHLERIVNIDIALVDSAKLLNDIQELLKKKGLYWIEALSYLKKLKAGSPTLAAVAKYTQSTPMKVCRCKCSIKYIINTL